MSHKVSVSIITYNQEEFIAQAIESALMQKVDFDYEIIIGEDDSSDGTREIVRSYKERHPDRIRLFLGDRKNVIYVNGRPTGRWNLVNNLKHARGQYVAWLDGDDYWTSPDKLQRQVDFLDGHSECAMCFHDVMKRYEDENIELRFSSSHRRKDFYTIEDLLDGNFIAACSVMFRNRLFGEFPDWYYQVPTGDWPLHILNAQHGNIGYINEVMSVHRIHAGGLRSSESSGYMLQSGITLLETLRRHMGPEYGQKLNDSIARRYLRLAFVLVRAKDYSGARSCMLDLLSRNRVATLSLVKAVPWIFANGVGALKRRSGFGQEANLKSERPLL